ncbi:tetratricopeptide repeat protein [Kribbella sp. NPDC000426]|uniref:ATP-binding protein n=1 Tax=Kribbella sp. NPDC000426 TaxID=3154255 RepID=UPI00333002E3
MGLDGQSSSGEQRFGVMLRHYRALAGMSQEALAQRAGLSRRGIADLERGARNSPYPDTARRLADALQLGPEDRDEFMAACGRDPRAARYSLPIEPSPIVGRQPELADLDVRARTSRLLTLTGPGGVGKTRLALELARELAAVHRDGAVLVDLAPVVDGAIVSATVAATLGVIPPTVERVREHLHSKQLVLVLDNCEHLVSQCALLVDELLRDAADLRVLATSREPLRIPGETVWVVPPLTIGDSVAFLSRQAQAAGAPAFSSDEANVVRHICRQLEGLPLAIELAAAHVPALGVAQVAELLADRLDFLARGARNAPPRHRTLRAALDWSFTLLDPTEQRVMTRLASFKGGWTLDAACDVCVDDELSRGVVVVALEGLVEKSLVTVEDTGGGRRYRFLETVHEYAAVHLGGAADADIIRDRHAAYFLTLAGEGSATRLGIPYPGDMKGLRGEIANLRVALQWFLEGERLETGLNMCQVLSGFWLAQGFLLEGEEWFSRYLERADELTSPAVAAGLYSWGRIAEYGGDLDRALGLIERSRSMSSEFDDRTVWCRATCGVGDLMLHRSKYIEAIELYESALRAADTAGGLAEKAQAMLSLSRATRLMGDSQHAALLLEQALALQRQRGDRWGVAYALNEMAMHARRDGRLDEALRLLEESHVLWRQSGTRMGERASVMNLALVSLELGRVRRAAELSRQGLELSQEIGETGSAASVRCLEIAAQTLGGLGAMATAVQLIAAAADRRSQLDVPRPPMEESEILRLLSAAQAQLGKLDEAPVLDVRDAIELAVDELMKYLES